MNKVIIKGRLTADPELSNTASAVEYCKFTVAVDRYAGKDKEKETDFVPCTAWRQTAVFINKYFSKGKEILILGTLRFDKYEKDGEKRTFASVQVDNAEFCGGKGDGKADININPSGPAEFTTASADFTEIVDSDDDLPF